MYNNTAKDVEKVYRCGSCGAIWDENVVGRRPMSSDKYCKICQGKVFVIKELNYVKTTNISRSRKRSNS